MTARGKMTVLAAGAIVSALSSLPAAAQETAMLPDSARTTRGIVKAVNEATISSELGYRILALPFREGQGFRKGDTLVAFACDALKAELQSAEARKAAEQITLTNNTKLAKHNAVGRLEVDLSKAKVDQAAADTEVIRVKLAECAIRAPFDGRVATRSANIAELTDRSRPIMHIVSDQDLEIEMLLPADWLRWLKIGEAFTIRLEERGTSLTARVAQLSPMVDPVSQTIKVVGRFTGDPSGVLPGMSGPVEFTVPNG